MAARQDHKDLHHDIDTFPYRIHQRGIDARILSRLKDFRAAPQVHLSQALGAQKAEDLEASFFRDTGRAQEVSRITGDLISLLLGVNTSAGCGIFSSDMTLQEFVERLMLADVGGRRCESHPDALTRIVPASVSLMFVINSWHLSGPSGGVGLHGTGMPHIRGSTNSRAYPTTFPRSVIDVCGSALSTEQKWSK